MIRTVFLSALIALLGASVAEAKPGCRGNGPASRSLECLADRVDSLESELRRAIVLFERHHCPEGWIKLDDSTVKEIGGTFRNKNLPLVYCKRLEFF